MKEMANAILAEFFRVPMPPKGAEAFHAVFLRADGIENPVADHERFLRIDIDRKSVV